MQDIEEILEDFKPLMEFSNFFSLLSNEEIEGFFWQDADGNSVDCNIYQPKYGGITLKLDIVNQKSKKKEEKDVNFYQPFAATPFENSTGYRINGKNISCKWHLECVCVDGPKLYSKDRIEIFKKPFSFPQHRYASTNEDFEFIFQREIAAANYKDSESFREYLIAKISEMKALEQSLPANDRKRSLDLQDLADRFLEWLNKRTEIDADAANDEKENDFTLSTIEDWLSEFKERIPQTSYDNLIQALHEYFKTGKFPKTINKIVVTRVSIKTFAKAFGGLHYDLKPLEKKRHATAYLSFLKDNISTFEHTDKRNLLKYL